MAISGGGAGGVHTAFRVGPQLGDKACLFEKVGLPAPVAREQGGPPVRTGGAMGGSAAVRLENNARLSQRVAPMLPPGANVQSAAAGFRNEGEFIAALHASKNLGIPFEQLKSRMTEGDGMPLGKAIQQLRPEMDKKDVKESVRTAERMAKQDVRAAKIGHLESAAAAEIRRNPRLQERLTPLLPEGMTFEQSSAGFKSTGQFVAALHVSKNLGIPFKDLRARMIAGGESLGEAIRALRSQMPEAEVEAAVRTATQASAGDLRTGAEAGTTASVKQ